ncbi:hypothetical protein EUTSA_v10006350mg [Eutrema salsugineum]|uniref:Uncharacterized protein n=1 Tax=Eutrema salsugineum TaxID=72664 RepID=V4LPW4_EUTSA|nr:hypothetical protein EUTSA_v10006350mg [Eutrema salsugineum]
MVMIPKETNKRLRSSGNCICMHFGAVTKFGTTLSNYSALKLNISLYVPKHLITSFIYALSMAMLACAKMKKHDNNI